MSEIKNPLEMSDEDFAKLNAPSPAPAGDEGVAAADDDTDKSDATDSVVDDTGAAPEAGTDDDDDADKSKSDDDGSGKTDDVDADKDKAAEGEDDKSDTDDTDADKVAEGDKKADKAADKTTDKTAEKSDKSEKAATDTKAETTAVATFQVPTSIKANGKTIELKSAEEALGLMQMGANYTRKLQQLQPHQKMVNMLQNNDLLDESKLSFLIDLEKGDLGAIKKLIKDRGIDPLELDLENVDYRPGDHIVTDLETNFRSQMEELTSSSPEGKATVQEIFTNWDQTSKDVLWKEPNVMSVIHAHRESGVYNLIKDEVDRLVTLGEIPVNTPFLQSYKQVGDFLEAEGAFEKLKPAAKESTAETKPEPSGVVTTRAAAPKSTVKDGDKAAAASPTKSSSKSAEAAPVNPLAMADDEFLKKMQGRL